MAVAETAGMGKAKLSTQEPFLRIENVIKRFGEFVALKEISLEIYPGEFVCFLGPSGCGKTTLLRAIAGLDIQSEGRIYQNGEDISALPPSERDFGIVFQSYALFPNLTVSKNVAYGLENRRMPRQQVQRRVTELLELVGLPDQGDKYPAQLSGGQQQRVALARALAPSPNLLLLDEPLSALDAKVRTHLRHEIKLLQRELGVTTAMVTHDQEEALTMADRIVVMNHGVIEQVGTPEQIYREPESAFVADFIGAMNFLTGEVTGQDSITIEGRQLRCETGELAVGKAVTLALRPEEVEVQTDTGAQDNSLDLKIVYHEFLGPVVRLHLGWEVGQAPLLRLELPAEQTRADSLKNGAPLTVRLPARGLRIFGRGER
ncbi:putative 2-aminoethylphosphonate ABC transporter ATP-binding protein [Limibacillus sp. MBR-115]|jgi:iron(III) transport system ATP-binding protein|uniref:putative 2-aminoethylphosphonate ABC transporter ATP-binding protein n=1 Tax=Limibacillus sp. MBR-115 TaxID=3156465 RepID=UPI00339152B8